MARIISAVGLVALAGLSACISPEKHRQVLRANDALQAQINNVLGLNEDLMAANDQLSQRVHEMEPKEAAFSVVEKQRKELERLLAEMRSSGSLNLDGVKLVSRREGVAFQVQGKVLFASGKVELTAQGKQTLSKLVQLLQKEGKKIRVTGHTDSDPIRNSKWVTNLRLSSERALTVADFLVAKGMSAKQVSVAGYGEHLPLQAGSSKDVKAVNRRVEILLLDH